MQKQMSNANRETEILIKNTSTRPAPKLEIKSTKRMKNTFDEPSRLDMTE